MKKHWLFTTLVALALCVICFTLFPTEAQAASTSDLTFTLNSDGQSYAVSECRESASGMLTIPATYNGKPVTSIGSYAFSYCTRLTSVTIPDGVTSISDCAFNGCSSLTGIFVSERNPNYSSDTYGVLFNKEKTALIVAPKVISANYTIPDSVTSIGTYAFCGCTRLTSVTIPDSVTSIGEGAFCGCSSLTSITIPASVTSIGGSAFSSCDNLTSVTIGDSVTSIGDYAFNSCYDLETVYYRGDSADKSNIQIGTGNSYLTSAYWWYNACIGTGDHAYTDSCDTTCNVCKAVRTPPHSYTNACDTTCNVCSVVRTVPDHVYYDACDTTCHECGATRSITHTYDNVCDNYCNVCDEWRYVPHSYDNICDTTCNNCSYERDVDHDYDNTCDEYCNLCGGYRYVYHYYTNDYDTTCNRCSKTRWPGFLEYKIINGGAQIWDCDTRANGSLTIPEELGGYPVTAIADYAFYRCEDLTDIIIPNGVTQINFAAFEGCRSLVNITIPATVTEIDDWAFYNCDNLINVYYAGSQEQWEKISIGSLNEDLMGADVIYTLATPTVKASNAVNGVKVTWNAISGAKNYKVYKSVYSGGKWSSWTAIKTGVTGTTYTDTSVKSADNVKYTVRAFNGSSSSDFVASNSIKFLATPTVTVSNATNGVKITWNAISGAKNYKVYKSVYSGGKWSGWTSIKTTTALSFTDTTAKKGVTYQYTVRAYSGSYKSSYTNSTSIKR